MASSLLLFWPQPHQLQLVLNNTVKCVIDLPTPYRTKHHCQASAAQAWSLTYVGVSWNRNRHSCIFGCWRGQWVPEPNFRWDGLHSSPGKKSYFCSFEPGTIKKNDLHFTSVEHLTFPITVCWCLVCRFQTGKATLTSHFLLEKVVIYPQTLQWRKTARKSRSVFSIC